MNVDEFKETSSVLDEMTTLLSDNKLTRAEILEVLQGVYRLGYKDSEIDKTSQAMQESSWKSKYPPGPL